MSPKSALKHPVVCGHLCPGNPRPNRVCPPAKHQRWAKSTICFCLTFHINVTYRGWNWCWQVICVCGMHFHWCVSLWSALLLHPSLPNAMSSLAHQSMARETAVLHQASHYSLCFLSKPGLLTTWVCDQVWSCCVSPQKSSHKVPYFSPDTWSGIRHCRFIHTINSCANTPGRCGSGLLEERQNTNEHHGRPI